MSYEVPQSFADTARLVDDIMIFMPPAWKVGVGEGI